MLDWKKHKLDKNKSGGNNKTFGYNNSDLGEGRCSKAPLLFWISSAPAHQSPPLSLKERCLSLPSAAAWIQLTETLCLGFDNWNAGLYLHPNCLEVEALRLLTDAALLSVRAWIWLKSLGDSTYPAAMNFDFRKHSYLNILLLFKVHTKLNEMLVSLFSLRWPMGNSIATPASELWVN